MLNNKLCHNEPKSSLAFATSSNNNRLINSSLLTKQVKNNLIQRTDHPSL